MSTSLTPSLPTAIVIFGGTGNLAETKLLPALFNLYCDGMLPEAFSVIGLSRKNFSHEQYQSYVAGILTAKDTNSDKIKLDAFCAHIQYASGSFSEPASYEQVKTLLENFDASLGVCTNKLFYLAVPPNLYSDIFKNLKTSDAMKLCDGVASWSRLLVEKPFGSDLITAQTLEAQLCKLFSEEQIYRIDHYLAKDTIENIISVRFANSILADSWDGTHIEHISLRLFETQDVATRGAFYDGIGALRDVGQNHMLQMLALLTMAPVDVRDPKSVCEGRLAALRSLKMHDTDLKIRGQYEGYTNTQGVNPQSTTETYFKIETHIDSTLWQNVCVSLESGKALHESIVEAVITFRAVDLCNCEAFDHAHTHNNTLTITFSPHQHITVSMWIKEPGFHFRLKKRELTLATEADSEVFRSPEAYERVLYDCIIGDQTRFVSGPEVEAAWNFITPILNMFPQLPLQVYKKGGAGPLSN